MREESEGWPRQRPRGEPSVGGDPPGPAAEKSGETAGAAPLRVEVSGRAWIVADLELLFEASDPLRDGLTW